MFGSRTWKCPRCGSVMQKSDYSVPMPFVSDEMASGTVWCEGCGAPFGASEVYAGEYDVRVGYAARLVSFAARLFSGFGVADAVWLLLWLLTWAWLIAVVWLSFGHLPTWAKVGLSIGAGIPAIVVGEFMFSSLDQIFVRLGVDSLFEPTAEPRAQGGRQKSTPGDTDERKAKPSVWPVYMVAMIIVAGSLSLFDVAGGYVVVTMLFGLAISWGLVRLRPWAWYCASVLTYMLGWIGGIGLVLSLGPLGAPISARLWLLLAAAWPVVMVLLMWSLKTRRRLFFPPKPEGEE